MGKGEIISEISGGEYLVKILFNRARVDARIEALTSDEVIPTEPDGCYYRCAKTGRTDLLSPVWPGIPGQMVVDGTVIWLCVSGSSESAVAWSAGASKKVGQVDATRDQADALDDGPERNVLLLNAMGLEKERDYLSATMPEDPTVTAWCADYTPGLTGEVGTIEVPGVRGSVLIQPGYEENAAYSAARDGQLQPAIAGAAAGVVFNMAMQPGWQKWKPTFRFGTITSLDTGTDTCGVDLDAATSVFIGQNINQAESLAAVPIEYMSCNASAFSVGDKVLIEFEGQAWDSPKVIGFASDPKPCITGAVSGGGFHTVGMGVDGTCVAVGHSVFEQCDVGGWTNIVAVDCAAYCSVGLKSDGTCVIAAIDTYNPTGGFHSDLFGNPPAGTPGTFIAASWTGIVAVVVRNSHIVGLKASGSVIADGDNGSGRCDVTGWTGIVAIAAGVDHTVGLKSDGTVVAVGDNTQGACNVTGWTNIVAIAAGSDCTIGVKSDGTCVATGRNDYGQCNVGGWSDVVDVAADYAHTVGLMSDGSCVATGRNTGAGGSAGGQCNVDLWSGIITVACGSYHTIGLKADGSCVAAGNNDFGQCNVTGWDLDA